MNLALASKPGGRQRKAVLARPKIAEQSSHCFPSKHKRGEEKVRRSPPPCLEEDETILCLD